MRDSFNEINITPLTDIFLVLLIIMMVIAPMLDQQGLNLAVPEIVNQEEIAKDNKIMNFIVTNDNKYYFDDKEIAAADLEKTVSARFIHCKVTIFLYIINKYLGEVH